MGNGNWKEQEVERLGTEHAESLLEFLEKNMGWYVDRVVEREITESFSTMAEEVVENVLRKRGSPCCGGESMGGMREED